MDKPWRRQAAGWHRVRQQHAKLAKKYREFKRLEQYHQSRIDYCYNQAYNLGFNPDTGDFIYSDNIYARMGRYHREQRRIYKNAAQSMLVAMNVHDQKYHRGYRF